MVKRFVLVAWAMALAPLPAEACGPFLPDTYLGGRETAVLDILRGSFTVETARLMERKPPDSDFTSDFTSGSWEMTLDADLADLHEALSAAGTTSEALAVTLKTYRTMRESTRSTGDSLLIRQRLEQLEALQKALEPGESLPWDIQSELYRLKGLTNREYPILYDVDLFEVRAGAGESTETLPSGDSPLPARLPREFALYARGAEAWRMRRYPEALTLWQELLALPPDQRRWRSTWAAFMIGKTHMMTDAAAALPWFERTRALAGEGFRDSARLAVESLGWQARAELRLGKVKEPIRRYWEMGKAGTRHQLEYHSLDYACSQAFTTPTLLLDLASDPVTRRLMTVYVSCGEPSEKTYDEWVKALEWSDVRPDAPEPDYLAWAAYSLGRFEDAARWIGQGGAKTPTGKWVQAKLLLRDGKIEEGVALLRSLVPLLPKDESWISKPDTMDETPSDSPRTEALAESGVLLLGRKEFVSALDALARSGYYWQDTAYLAERVLTVDELKNWLRSTRGDAELSTSRSQWSRPGHEELSWVLARRLARAGKWEEARPWFPPVYVPTFDDYVASYRRGQDRKLKARERAEALYTAATIHKEEGMELFGTENEPDWSSYGGSYDLGPGASAGRLADRLSTVVQEVRNEALAATLLASAEEKKRIRSNPVKPEKRFHYRYGASEILWECARLLPDNDPMTAAALYQGGVWHKNRDIPYADRFYQALVRRCAGLPIGKEADRLRWFPPEYNEGPVVSYRRPPERHGW